MNREESPIRGRHSEVALAAMRAAPPDLAARARTVHDRQLRCGWARPGGAARRHDDGARLDRLIHVTVLKHAMRDGGEIEIVIGAEHVTLSGAEFRLFHPRVPQAAMATLVGRPLSTLIELPGVLAIAGRATVLDYRDEDMSQLFVLDLPDVAIRRSDVGAEGRSDTYG